MTSGKIAGAALALAVGWGPWAGPSRAGDYVPFPRTPHTATELPPGYPPVDSSPSKTPFRDWHLFGRPLGCWASFHGYGCSSLHSELAFMFGSCRTFFGEPCLKGAPPSALPPWAGQESGYPPQWPAAPYAGPQGGAARGGGCSRCP